MFCIHCGKEVDDNSKFCAHCGGKLEAPAPEQVEPAHSAPEPEIDIMAGTGEASPALQEDAQEEAFLSQEPAAPKQKSYTWLIVTLIVLIVVLLIGIAVGSFFVFGGMKLLGGFGFGGQGGGTSSVTSAWTESVQLPTPTPTPIPTPEATPTPEPTPTPTPTPEPTPAPPVNQQRVVVESNGTQAALWVEEYQSGEWVTLFTTEARVGNNGVSEDYGEGKNVTPKGTFDVLFAIGIDKPDTGLDYRVLVDGDVWVDDTTSIYYNTIQNGTANGRWNSAEDIYWQALNNYWTHCILFSYNGDCVTAGSAESGRGSAIYLGGVGNNGDFSNSFGDIKVSADDILTILSLLDSDKNPQIIIR